jgi:RimJ/RimL family protein N-acetyltransferase
VEIRRLTEADAPAAWPLRLRALREDPEAFGSAYEEVKDRPLEVAAHQLAASDDVFTLGAFEGDTLVGTVTFVREADQKTRHKGLIVGMYTAPEARGRGIGRALLMEAIARCRALPGLVQLELAVVTENAAARALYRSVGFEPYGCEPRALRVGGRYLDEDLMVLRLA